MLMTLGVGAILGIAVLVVLAGPWPFLAPFVVLGIFVPAVLYRRPAWGLFGLALLVPFEGLFKGLGFSAAKLLGLALIAVLAVRFLLQQTPPQYLRSSLWRFIILFVLFVFLSLLYTENLSLSLTNLRELAIGMTFFVMTLLAGRALNLSRLYAGIALSVAATCLIALLSTRYQVNGRAIGLLQDANYFALLITIAAPAAVLMAVNGSSVLVRLFWLAITFLLLVGMAKTGSRSGLLVMVICLAIGIRHHWWRCRQISPRHFGFLVLGLALALPVLRYSVPEAYIDRVKSLSALKSGANAYQDASIGRRASYLLVGREMIGENPLLGAGPGTFLLYYAQSGYAKAFSAELATPDLYRRAHNTYLEILAEMGIPAGLFFMLLIIAGLNNFRQARQGFLQRQNRPAADLAVHLGLGLLSIALFMLFLSVPNHKYLWLFLALSSIVRQQAETAQTHGGRAM